MITHDIALLLESKKIVRVADVVAFARCSDAQAWRALTRLVERGLLTRISPGAYSRTKGARLPTRTQMEAVLQTMPGTARDIARRLKLSVRAVAGSIASIRKSGLTITRSPDGVYDLC